MPSEGSALPDAKWRRGPNRCHRSMSGTCGRDEAFEPLLRLAHGVDQEPFGGRSGMVRTASWDHPSSIAPVNWTLNKRSESRPTIAWRTRRSGRRRIPGDAADLTVRGTPPPRHGRSRFIRVLDWQATETGRIAMLASTACGDELAMRLTLHPMRWARNGRPPALPTSPRQGPYQPAVIHRMHRTPFAPTHARPRISGALRADAVRFDGREGIFIAVSLEAGMGRESRDPAASLGDADQAVTAGLDSKRGSLRTISR